MRKQEKSSQKKGEEIKNKKSGKEKHKKIKESIKSSKKQGGTKKAGSI